VSSIMFFIFLISILLSIYVKGLCNLCGCMDVTIVRGSEVDLEKGSVRISLKIV
jgi:hypothetical protein